MPTILLTTLQGVFTHVTPIHNNKLWRPSWGPCTALFCCVLFRSDHHILKETQFQCLVIMVLCLIVGCGTRTGKAHTHREKVRLFRVPRVITNQGEHVDGLTSTRRRQWISAISRANLTAEKLENERVCGSFKSSCCS